MSQTREFRVATSTIWAVVALGIVAVALLLFFAKIAEVLILFFMAIVLAEAIRPLVKAMRRVGIPRAVAVLGLYLIALLFFVGLGVMITPPLVAQLRLLLTQLPAFADRVQALLAEYYAFGEQLGITQQLRAAMADLASRAPQIVGSLVELPFRFAAGLLSIFSVLVLAYFWLSATEAIDRKLLPRFATSDQAVVRRIARRASESVGGWVRGELVLMLFVGSLVFVGLELLGVDYPVPLAFWAGLTEIIPLVGPWIGGIPAFAIALLSSPWLALGVFLVYLAVQQIENNLLVPKIMEQAVGLHPLIVLLALLAGGATMGLLGIVISVPFAALVQVLIAELLIPWLVVQSRRREMAEYIEAEVIAQEPYGEVPVGSQGRADDPEEGESLGR